MNVLHEMMSTTFIYKAPTKPPIQEEKKEEQTTPLREFQQLMTLSHEQSPMHSRKKNA